MPMLIASLILAAIAAGLKLIGALDWSWWLITVPLWLPIAALLAGTIGAFVYVWFIANKMK